MGTMHFDGQPIEVDGTETIVQVARRVLGIDIPTLCWLDGAEPVTSCMVCVVRVNGRPNLVPGCATLATPGITVESETEEITEIRRTTVELMFSEHLGDCLAPCTTGCPAGMDIPRMIRQVYDDQLPDALQTVIEHLPIPGCLSFVCRAPCENACRRSKADQPIAIAHLVRVTSKLFREAEVADLLKKDAIPGKRAAVVGSGPAGLSAAFYLRREGIEAVVFEARDQLGGDLRTDEKLPDEVLDAELDVLRRMGVEFRTGVTVGTDITLEALREEFDGVFVAPGAETDLPLPRKGKKLEVDARSTATPLGDVFVGGTILRPKGRMAVRSVADGKAGAAAIAQRIREETIVGAPRRWSTHIGKLQEGEIDAFLAGVSPDQRVAPAAGEAVGYTLEEADAEARRCMHCDCRQTNRCRLQDVGEMLDANFKRFRGERQKFTQMRLHPQIIFEPGKCINCGHCIRIAEEAGEELGMTFLNRGFDTTVGVPFDATLGDGIKTTALAIVDACPVGALAFKTEEMEGQARVMAAPVAGTFQLPTPKGNAT